MSAPGPRPEVGDLIWLTDLHNELVHICTVQDLLATMLRATYEVARGDGGWVERTMFAFYRECKWDAQEKRWVGVAG